MSEHIEVEVLMLKGDKGDAGATEWGGIAGAISDNNELQAALDKKADVESLKTLAISGKFSDVLEKPTTLEGYGISPETAYSEIEDLVQPEFFNLQGNPTENDKLKRELGSKATVAQFNNLNREVSILKSAVDHRATTTQVNELNNKVASLTLRKAESSALNSLITKVISNAREARDGINNVFQELQSALEFHIKNAGIRHFESNEFKKQCFLANHPVGSVYATTDSGNPSSLFGGGCGTWRLLEHLDPYDEAQFWERTW